MLDNCDISEISRRYQQDVAADVTGGLSLQYQYITETPSRPEDVNKITGTGCYILRGEYDLDILGYVIAVFVTAISM